MPNSDPKSDYQLDSRTSPHGPKMLKGIGIAVFVGLLVVFLNATQSKDIASIISFAFTANFKSEFHQHLAAKHPAVFLVCQFLYTLLLQGFYSAIFGPDSILLQR